MASNKAEFQLVGQKYYHFHYSQTSRWQAFTSNKLLKYEWHESSYKKLVYLIKKYKKNYKKFTSIQVGFWLGLLKVSTVS